MFDLITKYIPLVGGIGIIGVAAAAYFLGVGSVVTALSPILKSVAEVVGDYFKSLWDGFKDMIDNASSIIFVITVIAFCSWYFNESGSSQTVQCDKKIEQLHKDYKFIPRQKRSTEKTLFTNPLDWFKR